MGIVCLSGGKIFEFTADRNADGHWDSGPIFEALHDQLGLQVDRQTGSIQTFIIERVETPATN